MKPAVDAAVEKLQRAQIHDQERRHDERAKDTDGSRREPRARDMHAIVAYQLRDLAGKQRRQGHDAEQVEQQNPWLQAAEFPRVLHALREQQERPDADTCPQQNERNRAPARLRGMGLGHTGSDHVYHSLTRCQSSVQNMSARSDAGRRPRRKPARTLIR